MRTADADILIVPGLGNSGPDHWQSRWEAKLSSARRVMQADWDRPRIEAWRGAVAAAVEAAQKPVVLVTHSFGGVAAAAAAPALAGKIAGAFIVAPPAERTVREVIAATMHDADPDAFTMPLDALDFPSVLVASRDDIYASFEEAEALAAAWGSTIADAGAAGHINAESGHGPWPEGLLAFTQLLKKL